MLAKMKLYAIAIGGIAVAIGLTFLYIFGLGKKVERADTIVEAEKQEDRHDSLVDTAHRAGDAARSELQPGSKDPYDRANR